jgi:hypothetical protein
VSREINTTFFARVCGVRQQPHEKRAKAAAKTKYGENLVIARGPQVGCIWSMPVSSSMVNLREQRLRVDASYVVPPGQAHLPAQRAQLIPDGELDISTFPTGPPSTPTT